MMSFLPDFSRFFFLFLGGLTINGQVFALQVRRRRPTAVLLPSTPSVAQKQPACPLLTFDLLFRANVRSCQCHGRGRQRRLFSPPPSHVASAPIPMATPRPEILDKPGEMIPICPRGRSYRYNPPNDVKDLSARLLNDKTSPPPRHPRLKKAPLLPAEKIERRETLLISAPCILTLAVLNRSPGYKGQSRGFCVLKCG